MASFKLFKRNIEETAQTDAAENAIALKEVEGLSQRQIVFKRFIHHRAAMVAVFTTRMMPTKVKIATIAAR